jgi:hemolysin III
MVIKASLTTQSGLALIAVTLFGVSMILLYAASTAYHSVFAKDKVIAFLRRIDHSMIFILIAGTYAPFCLITLNGTLGWFLFILINGLAALGVTFKLTLFHSPRWLSTSIYVGMGWLIIFFINDLAASLATGGMIFLILGGVAYTIGAVIYALKPKFLEFKYMGFHEIFHVFILFGSLFHFISVYGYVL